MARKRPKGHKLSYSIIGGGTPTRGHASEHGYEARCACGWSVQPIRTGKLCEKEYASHVSEVAKGKCSSCGEDLSEAQRRRNICDQCRLGQKKNYRDRDRQKDPQLVSLKARRATVKSKYGISPVDVDLMMMFQNNECPICSRPLQSDRKTGLHIDHCHRTGRIRGLLCGRCNQALGFLGDNVITALKAAHYLLSQRSESKAVIPAHGRLGPSASAETPPPDLHDVARLLDQIRSWVRIELKKPHASSGAPHHGQ